MTATRIYDIATDLLVIPDRGKLLPRDERKPVTTGLVPQSFKPREGTMMLTPAMAATVGIERLDVNGGITGYQREIAAGHIREMARAMVAGKPFPSVQLAITEDGSVVAVDGQQRLLATIIAKKNIRAEIRSMTYSDRRDMFQAQGRARKIDRNYIILAGTDPFEQYVQRAVIAHNSNDMSNPWALLISAPQSSNSEFLTPAMVHRDITAFCWGTVGYATGTSRSGGNGRTAENMLKAYDEKLCDTLGHLLRSFGVRATNPYAFETRARKPLVVLAVLAIKGRGGKALSDSVGRWQERMPLFPFADYRGERNGVTYLSNLVRHWNSRCPKAIKIDL